MARLRRLIENTVRYGASFASLVLACLMGLITIDVVGRYILNEPVQGSFEFSEFMMVALVFGSLAYGQYSKQNIRVTLITQYFNRRTGLLLSIFSDVIALSLWILITWGGAHAAIRAWEIQDCTASIVPLPLWPVKSLVPIGGAMFCFQFMLDICDQIKVFWVLNKSDLASVNRR